MKIEPHHPLAGTGSASALRKKHKVSGGGNFAALLDEIGASEEPAAPEEAAPPAPVGAMDAMLLAQEVSDEELQRKKFVRHGHLALDALEQLKLSILLGDVTVDQLENIRQRLQRQKAAIHDPRLRELINDIEVRAAVELAKFGR